MCILQEEMRDTNESTNSRVLYFSLFSMCCLLGLATWQVSTKPPKNLWNLISDWQEISGALPEKVLQVQEADRIGMKVITVRTEESWLLWRTIVWLHTYVAQFNIVEGTYDFDRCHMKCSLACDFWRYFWPKKIQSKWISNNCLKHFTTISYSLAPCRSFICIFQGVPFLLRWV